jgi:uncharacterized alkaline shock family protein YloU
MVTSNLYGKIVVSNQAIRTVAGASALECVGVWGLSGRFKPLTVKALARRKSFGRSVRVYIKENRIYLEINVILKYGVSVDAVTESIRSSVKYNVENFSGMIVECISINILGIKN